MEQIWTFSLADNSIDLIGGFIFIFVFAYSVYFFIKNNLNQQGKILYVFTAFIAFLHIVQVILQLSGIAPNQLTFRLWDIINYSTAMLLMMVVHRIYRTEKH